MASENGVHPLLDELLGAPNISTKKTNVSALDLLQRLLETNIVSTDQIQKAYDSLTEEEEEEEEEGRGSLPKKAESEISTQQNAAAANDTDTAMMMSNANNDQEMPSPPGYRTRHIALHIYYEGKQYSGLAQNVGMENDSSVERKLFQALQTTRLIQSRDESGYSRCGRTDKGVSSVGQVVALRLKSAIPLDASWDPEGKNLITEEDDVGLPKNSSEKIQVYVPPNKKQKKKVKKKKKNKKGNNSQIFNPQQEEAVEEGGGGGGEEESGRILKEISEYPFDKMLNGLLPEDIRVLGWCPVSKEFSARFSANSRTYRYFFVPRDLNLNAMHQALKFLEGTHDFRNFCKLNVVEVSNYVRKIHSADLVVLPPNQGACYFQIHGQAFLWHQIRCIVTILFLVGRGLESPSVVAELLDVQKYPAKPSYPLAPEYPLVLHDCGFPNLKIGYSVKNCWIVTCQLEEQWERLLLEATRVRNCLERLKEVNNIRREELAEYTTRKLMERHKKQQRSNNASDEVDWMAFIEQIEKEQTEEGQSDFMSWGESMSWLRRWRLSPDVNGLRDHIHIPLLQRSMGTTYEEKIETLQQASSKRAQRFEENAAKKLKSQAIDGNFYEHMLKQGGSAI